MQNGEGVRGGARMSIADKTKIKDMQEQLERITGTQKKVQNQLLKINIDKFIGQLDEIEKQLRERCLKADTA